MANALTKPKPTELTKAEKSKRRVVENEVSRAWSARSHVIAGFLGLLLLVGGFGTWSVTTDIAGAIIAPGAIEAENNRQVVQHPDGGVVEKLLVREGDTVEEGQVLIKLDPEKIQSELTIVQNQLFELIARRGRLEAERDGADKIIFDPLIVDARGTDPAANDLMDGQERLFEQRRENIAAESEQLQKRIEQIANQNEGINAQQNAMSIQLDLIRQELANKQSLLDKGLAQSSVVLALQRDQASIMGQQGELTSMYAQNEGRITEIEIQILNLQQRRREEAITTLRDLGYQELELAERRRALIAQLGRLEIRAPFPGVIYAMQIFAEREVIRPAQPLLYIVPQDNRLIIAAQVQTINIDEIHVGQEVNLRFSALSDRTTPELVGRVINVSPDAFTDEKTGHSFYRARIEIMPGELARLPEGTLLVPGMPVESYLRTSDRTPLAYLIKPLADYFNKAFRES